MMLCRSLRTLQEEAWATVLHHPELFTTMNVQVALRLERVETKIEYRCCFITPVAVFQKSRFSCNVVLRRLVANVAIAYSLKIHIQVFGISKQVWCVTGSCQAELG